MKNSHKIFTYSDESNYVVCTCEISNQARIKIKESIKKNKVSYDVIHKLENTDINKVREAKRVAEEGKIQNLKAVTIAKNMRAVVSWDDMVKNIEK